MFRNNIKFYLVIVLCLCGIVLSAGLVMWIFNRDGRSGNASSNVSKYASWAERVTIDPGVLYQVTDVVDGDTIKTLVAGHEITVRLLGINTPETVDPRKSVECFGPEASVETKSLLSGKSVLLALNPNYERTDKYGRLLAYVRLADPNDVATVDLFVNEFLVKEGYAYEYTFNASNPYQYQTSFKADESQAKSAKKGLWGKCVSVGQKAN